jgi:hypothetical protein
MAAPLRRRSVDVSTLRCALPARNVAVSICNDLCKRPANTVDRIRPSMAFKHANHPVRMATAETSGGMFAKFSNG